MTVPSFHNFLWVLGGWVFARRRTLTGILIAGGLAGQRHHASFHPLLAEAAWSLDALGLALFRMIEPLLPAGSVLVAIDDTLARKLGRKVFGVGMHHDPLLSSRGKAITNWRHSWVILGVIVQFPLPTPEQMLAARAVRLTLDLYGRHDQVRVAEAQGRVHSAPERLLKIVAVELLTGGRKRQAFYSTCAEASALAILSWYALRWSIEVAFHDSKTHLGFEEPQGWPRKAVQRTAPTAMVLYSLIVLWFVQEGHRHYLPATRPWYTSKSHPTFTDMLAPLRRESLREQIYRLGLTGPNSRKILETLENTVALAA
jgi:hypothetical protein